MPNTTQGYELLGPEMIHNEESSTYRHYEKENSE
jgi:hypothetical protein